MKTLFHFFLGNELRDTVASISILRESGIGLKFLISYLGLKISSYLKIGQRKQAPTVNPITEGSGKPASEFQASLFYRTSIRTARAVSHKQTQRKQINKIKISQHK